MEYGDFIILGVFAIGYIIIFHCQKNKIDSLITQVDSQSDSLSAMQKFMSIFKLEEIEKYVEMSRKKFLLEKEEEMKAFKDKLVAITKKNYDFLFNGYMAASKALIDLSFVFGTYPYFEETIMKMKSVFTKENLLESINKRKEELKAQELDKGIWSSFWVQDMFLKSLSEKKEK